MGDQLQTLDQVKATVIDMAIKFGPKVLVAIIILTAGYMAGRWAGRIVGRLLHRLRLEPPVRALLVRMVQVLVVVLFAIMALKTSASNYCR